MRVFILLADYGRSADVFKNKKDFFLRTFDLPIHAKRR